MSEWRSDELSPAETKAFGALSRYREPPTVLEEHVVAELRRRKVLWRKRRPALWLTLGTIAASVGMVYAVWTNVRVRPPAPPSPQAATSPEAHWVLLLKEGREDRSVSSEESRRRVSEYASWARANRANGLIDGEKLGDKGILLSGSTGLPFERTPETIAGYFLLGAVDARVAREIALSCPHLKYGGDIELRQIETTSGNVVLTPRERESLKQLGYVDVDDR